MEKLILTDCDGVLLNWEWAFRIWMEEHGYTEQRSDTYEMHLRYGVDKHIIKEKIRVFNESAAIGFLPPLRDAVEYVTRLAEDGWRFHVITSLSTEQFAVKLRKRNLEKLFGPVFDEIVCLDTGADKDDALAKYRDSNLFWIEDKVENAEAGVKAGLHSILIEHGHNMNNLDYPMMRNWSELHTYVNSFTRRK